MLDSETFMFDVNVNVINVRHETSMFNSETFIVKCYFSHHFKMDSTPLFLYHLPKLSRIFSNLSDENKLLCLLHDIIYKLSDTNYTSIIDEIVDSISSKTLPKITYSIKTDIQNAIYTNRISKQTTDKINQYCKIRFGTNFNLRCHDVTSYFRITLNPTKTYYDIPCREHNNVETIIKPGFAAIEHDDVKKLSTLLPNKLNEFCYKALLNLSMYLNAKSCFNLLKGNRMFVLVDKDLNYSIMSGDFDIFHEIEQYCKLDIEHLLTALRHCRWDIAEYIMNHISEVNEFDVIRAMLMIE